MSRYLDRAQMTVSGTPGTGAITCSAAVPPYQTISAAATAQGPALAVGDVIWALVQDTGNAWEIYPATVTNASGPVLSAPDSTDPRFQSSSGSVLSLTSAATVTCDFPAIMANLLAGLSHAAFGGQG